jgi:hypothetical protein
MVRAQPLQPVPLPADAKKDTDPALSISSFLDLNFDLTKLYLDLAERHNTLVDAVEQHLKEQANSH